MNKAKIMLSALGVLAVVGSGLAFKAHRAYGGNLRCATTTTVAGAAPIPNSNCTASTYATTTVLGNNIRHCTIINEPELPCVTQRVAMRP